MISAVFSKLKKIGWFIPGFLLYAAFPPMCETTDVLFALAPLIWLSRQGDARTSAKRWAQSGFFFWIATLSWMLAIIKNGGPWPLVLLGWGALAAYCTLYFAAYGYLSAAYWRWASGRDWRSRLFGILVVEPVLWCGLELVRSRLFGGFAWNQLGVVPVNAGFGSPAALGGVYLCSAVVLLVNGTVAGIAERVVANIRMRWKKTFDRSALNPWRTLETLVVFAVIGTVYAIGSASVFNPPHLPNNIQLAQPLKVALVQRNFPCCFKTQDENPIEIYSNLLQNAAIFKPDLIVLPESAMSEFGLIDGNAFNFVMKMRPLLGDAAVLAGGTRTEKRSSGIRIFNSAGLYWPTQDGYIGFDSMDKVHLVPFGEYIPGDKFFPALQKLAPVGSCTPGEPHLLQENRSGSPFGVAICFEDTDSALMREYARRGARFLALITNDSWFSNSNEALAHAWQATARAIETGLPIVRVGNSGVTGTITPTGKANWLFGEDGKVLTDRPGMMFDRISVHVPEPLDGIRTPYVRYGDIPLLTLFILLISTYFLVQYKDYVHEKRRRMSLQVR